MTKTLVSFEVWEWSEWVEDIIYRCGELIYDLEGASTNDVTVENLLHAPALDPENPKAFCKHFMFDGIYEDNILVRHHTDKTCFWFINSDNTALIYRPKLIKTELES